MSDDQRDELELHALTFDEVVDRIREPLAGLAAVADELDPAVRDFVDAMLAALARYDEAGDAAKGTT